MTDKFEVKLYGSRATNLCLKWSDLDVVITRKNPKTTQLQSTNLLDKLHIVLKEQDWVKSIKYIFTAKVPIIKLTTNDKYNSMQVDISIEDRNHYGLKCVDLVKEYIAEFEVLEPLVFAAKTLLKFSNLNDPYKGGISSYGIILMIVAFIKKEKKKGKAITINSLGDLFYEFLLFYGSNVNSNYVNVNEENNEVYNTMQPFDLLIVDPLNENNNVGKSAFQFFNIKVMFLIALQSIGEDCCCGCHYMSTMRPNSGKKEEPCVHNVLRKMFNAVRRAVINGNMN